MACQGSGLFPSSLSTGPTEGGNLTEDALSPIEEISGLDGGNSIPPPGGSVQGFGNDIYAVVPTQDAGEVGPMVDMDEVPLITMGKSDIICQYEDGEFLYEISGRVRWNPDDDHSDKFYDVEPGPLGMTLRLVHNDERAYKDFPVVPVGDGACLGPGLCQKNAFVARFKTPYPFPSAESGGPLYTFWLSEPNHEAQVYNEWQNCPENPMARALYEGGRQFVPVDTDFSYSFCKPKHWGFVTTWIHSFKNPPETDGVLSCKLLLNLKAQEGLEKLKTNLHF